MRFTQLKKILTFAILVFASACAFGVDCNTAGYACMNLDSQIKGSRLPSWGVDSGSSNAYAITTVAPLGPALKTGSVFMFKATHANTSASTLVVDGGSTIAIKKNVSSALTGGEIALNGVTEVVYDGTNFQCMSCGSSTGTVTSIATTSPITGGTITTTGTISCPTCAIGPGSSSANHLAKFSGTDGLTLADGGAIPTGTVTSVAETAPSGLLSVSGSPITTSGTFAWSWAGTSGGISYFSSTSALASSALLTNHALVVGGGTGAAPSVVSSLGTTTTVLHGNASANPSFGAVSLTADVSGILPVANGGNGTATPTLSPGANVTLAGTWPNYTINAATGSGGSGTSTARPNTRRWAYGAQTGDNNSGNWSGTESSNVGFSGSLGSAATGTATCGPTRTGSTAATIGSVAGEGNSAAPIRNWNYGKNPMFQAQVALNNTSNVRQWLVFTDQTIATVGASATPAGNSTGFRYDTGAGDTHWQCGSSASGSWTFVDTGVTPDTSCHTFEVLVTSGTNAVCKIDGGSATTVSSNLPANSTMLGWQDEITALAASIVSIKWSYHYWEQDP
jgi:hypothetical protein